MRAKKNDKGPDFYGFLQTHFVHYYVLKMWQGKAGALQNEMGSNGKCVLGDKERVKS